MSGWEPIELEYKPDAAEALRRVEAWWTGAVLDRPTIQIVAPKPVRQPVPEKAFTDVRDRWLDAEHVVASTEANLRNTWFGGEYFPSLNPNLGPEILSAAYGAELRFSESTSWSIPCLESWDDIDRLRFDPDNFYVRKILEITRLSLEQGRGKWLTGYTDLHPGGDLAASLRDPQQFCIDIAMEPDQVKRLLARLEESFFRFYELQEELIHGAGQRLATAWLPMVAEGRYYVPSNDFSCMISAPMFREFFVPELVMETEWLDRSVYHLDGPDALRHLDALLEMDALDGVQYVYGAGNEPASRWLHVYRRIQEAGKRIHVSVTAADLDPFMQALDPEGVMMCLWVGSVEEGEAVIRRISRWTRRGCF